MTTLSAKALFTVSLFAFIVHAGGAANAEGFIENVAKGKIEIGNTTIQVTPPVPQTVQQVIAPAPPAPPQVHINDGGAPLTLSTNPLTRHSSFISQLPRHTM